VRAKEAQESQIGIGNMKTIVWLLILVSVCYAGTIVVPIFFANYEFEDKIKEEAEFAQQNHRSQEQLRDIVYREAQRLNLPVRLSDIAVKSNPEGFLIRAPYTVKMDLFVYQSDLYFSPTSRWP
jgi:hypothetical protein